MSDERLWEIGGVLEKRQVDDKQVNKLIVCMLIKGGKIVGNICSDKFFHWKSG